MKLCTRCGQEKPLDEFRLGGTRSNGKRYRESDCNDCHRRASRAYRDAHLDERREAERTYARANAERKRENARRWYAANRDRALERARKRHAADPEYDRDKAHQSRAKRAGAPLIEFVRRQVVYDRDRGMCHVCDEFVAWEDYEMDHVIPLSAGGDHTYANVRVSHGDCNRRRLAA